MSHHSNNPFNRQGGETYRYRETLEKGINEIELGELLSNDKTPPPSITEPGPTGNFPEGKLTEDDQGEIRIDIALFEGKVVLNFGKKPITWIAMNKDQALQLASYIKEKAELIKPIV